MNTAKEYLLDKIGWNNHDKYDQKTLGVITYWMEAYAKYYYEQQAKSVVLQSEQLADVGKSLPDAEQCLKIQEQVKQYCYTDQDDNPVISSGGIRAIISRWKQMIG